MDFFSEVISTFQSQDAFEYVGLVAGLIYVIFAARNNSICWYFGIISCAAIAFKDFTDYRLYLDGVLQVFYVGMGVWGLFLWKYGNQKLEERPIRSWPFSSQTYTLLGLLFVSLIAGIIIDKVGSVFPYLDALTTVFSIYATFLLVFRVIQNWIVWIITDLIYVYLYYAREATFFALLLLIYTVIAIYGYTKWRREFQNQKSPI